jgi:beta-propeller repeat-containing protein
MKHASPRTAVSCFAPHRSGILKPCNQGPLWGRSAPMSVLLLAAVVAWALAPPAAAAADTAVKARLQEAYVTLPLSFEANQGQTDPRVQFLSRGPGYTFFLTPTVTVLALRQPAPQAAAQEAKAYQSVLRMQLVGATPASSVRGLEELPGKANYFLGNDPKQWRTDVPTYARVKYQNVYPGIDVVYYGNQQQLEFDFIVSPGADPGAIRLDVEGADRLEIDAQEDLLLHSGDYTIRLRRPFMYQETNGLRQEVPGRYVLTDAQQVGFTVGAYDGSKPLVIDPTLFYSTYLGGSGRQESYDIAVDSVGNAYVTGFTSSTDFPTANPLQGNNGGGQDAFVTKLNAAGAALVYSTYLGGNGLDIGQGIAVDAAGNAYVTGQTTSSNFPRENPFQSSFSGFIDAFVTKLNAAGDALVYSTYLGGGSLDTGQGIAVDSAGNAYVTGFTISPNFPTTPGSIQTAFGGNTDAFVTKLNAAGAAPVYSTYLGGSGDDNGTSIALDSSANAYVTGVTNSTDFPTANPLQASNGGGQDAFVTKLNAAGAALLSSTYLGGSQGDAANSIALDAAGNAYVTGSTAGDFPTASPFQAIYGGGTDAFVAKLNLTDNALVYSTYLGGSGLDVGQGIAVDSAGTAYVAGHTNSPNFPTTADGIQTAFGGNTDAFVTKLNAAGSAPVYSTYLGGSGDDKGTRIALDPSANAYVTGFTASTDFLTTPEAFKRTLTGGVEAFVAKIIETVAPPPQTEGKVMGVGSINVPEGVAFFAFIVQRKETDGQVTGVLLYFDHASGAKVFSTAFSSLVIAGNTASFGGACTNHGTSCTFSVTVEDNGRPSANDKFTITIDAGPPKGGTLRSGFIHIH